MARATYLSVGQMFNLTQACQVFTDAYGHCTYLVGSVLLRADYRDVDVRCILADDKYDALIEGNQIRLKLLNTSLSEWLQARTGLPIDFQFQRQTEANAEFDGMRNSLNRVR